MQAVYLERGDDQAGSTNEDKSALLGPTASRNPALVLLNASGQRVVELGSSLLTAPDGSKLRDSGRLKLANSEGKSAVFIGARRDNENGLILLYDSGRIGREGMDENKAILLQMGKINNGGDLRILNDNNEIVVEMFVDESGRGHIRKNGYELQ